MIKSSVNHITILKGGAVVEAGGGMQPSDQVRLMALVIYYGGPAVCYMDTCMYVCTEDCAH